MSRPVLQILPIVSSILADECVRRYGVVGQTRAMDPAAADRLDLVLTVSCPDRPGLVHAVTGWVVGHAGNIGESQQYSDRASNSFFMRVHLEVPTRLPLADLDADFAPLAARLAMSWQLVEADRPTRALILVSREGHCLNDLLFRNRSGGLNLDIVGVLSNHDDLGDLARTAGVEFSRLPTRGGPGEASGQTLLDRVDATGAELVILARYMQILPPEVCERLAGRAINIHHSFLPGFSGARPYHQAHQRGVKLIGATAHYVTAELDAGPIIEQEVARVDHTATPARLAAVGRDIEAQVLARAVRWHTEHRVMRNGARTVVFR